MEAAGLAIGAVTLVSFWETCVQGELFDVVASAQHFDEECELVRIKLDVERVRLFEWGEAVGLIKLKHSDNDLSLSIGGSSLCGVHPQLARPYKTILARDILGYIRRLFEDTEALQRHYGLQHVQGGPHPYCDDTSPRALRFIFKRAYASVQALAKVNAEKVNLRTRTQWAISDKGKFTKLTRVYSLTLNDSLADLFPGTGTITRNHLRRDIEASDEIRSLVLLERASSDDYAEFSGAARMRISVLQARASLGFSEQPLLPGNDHSEADAPVDMSPIEPAPAPAGPSSVNEYTDIHDSRHWHTMRSLLEEISDATKHILDLSRMMTENPNSSPKTEVMETAQHALLLTIHESCSECIRNLTSTGELRHSCVHHATTYDWHATDLSLPDDPPRRIRDLDLYVQRALRESTMLHMPETRRKRKRRSKAADDKVVAERREQHGELQQLLILRTY
ncbi:prion-inhibition and propagation-domain-containing protein [Schizophyllum commune]